MFEERDNSGLRLGEFVALMALMISLVALSIDAMLPALPAIGEDLGAADSNDNQLVISALFFGMAFGQLFYGPISDSTGRKPTIYLGFVLFIGGCLLSLFATSFDAMLLGRLLQGIGVAGPRIVALAVVRDQYQGRAMARIMSFVMAVFIMVPALAPALGQAILIFAHWRAIFVVFLMLALVASIWFALRQPETLPPQRRVPFSLKRIALAVYEVVRNPSALGYTLAAGLIFGSFVAYLNLAQPIFQAQYGLGTQFPLYFGILALAIGSASFVNGRLVMRYGMRLLSTRALIALCALSWLFLAVAYGVSGEPPLWALMAYCMAAFFCFGILFGNLNAMAMEPLGHIAGVGAAVVGSLSTFISVPLGVFIGQHYNGTVLPLIGGFALLSAASLSVLTWTHRRVPAS